MFVCLHFLLRLHLKWTMMKADMPWLQCHCGLCFLTLPLLSAHLLFSTSQQWAVNAPPQLLHLLRGALVNQN